MKPYIGSDDYNKILIVGSWPGPAADREDMPFDKTVMKMLRKAVPGQHWDRLSFQNVVRCATASKPTFKAASHSCAEHLAADVAAYPYRAILGLGDEALKHFAPDWHMKTKASDASGCWLPVTVNGQTIWYYNVLGLDVLAAFGDDDGTAWPVFKADIKKFFAEVDKKPAPVIHDIAAHHVTIVDTLEQAEAIANRMGPVAAWDVEANGLRPTLSSSLFLSAAFSDGNITFAFSVDHPLQRNKWAKKFIAEFLNSRERWVAHQLGMELAWARFFCGVEITPERFEDTMGIARIRHNTEKLGALANQSRLHLGVNVKLLSDLDVRNLIAYPLPEVLRYNGLDAYATFLLYDKFKETASNHNYRRLIESICSVTEMQLLGLDCDIRRSQKLSDYWSEKAAAAEAKARNIYEIREWERNTQREWSIGSDQDTSDALVRFGKVLLPKSAAGNYLASEPILLAAAPDNPLVRAVLDYREASKMKSTYVDPVIAAVRDHCDGKAHPCYSVMLVSTGRLSSEDFNIQNFPSRVYRELRSQIVAPPGHIFVSFDFGQLEARIVAMASKCRLLIISILNGLDIHGDWGPQLGELVPEFFDRMIELAATNDEKKVLKVIRNEMKGIFVFGLFFGASAGSTAAKLKVPEWAIQTLMDRLWKLYPEIKNWHRARRKEYNDTGSSRTLTGRTRHGIMNGNEPINNPIQGTGADVVNDAMNECSAVSRAERDPYMHPRIQIHDDLTFIWPDDDRLDLYISRVFRIMAKCRYDWQTLPFMIEAKMGYNWCDMEEFATYTGDYVQ